MIKIIDDFLLDVIDFLNDNYPCNKVVNIIFINSVNITNFDGDLKNSEEVQEFVWKELNESVGWYLNGLNEIHMITYSLAESLIETDDNGYIIDDNFYEFKDFTLDDFLIYTLINQYVHHLYFNNLIDNVYINNKTNKPILSLTCTNETNKIYSEFMEYQNNEE